MARKKIVIIGAGPSGLAAAMEALDNDLDPLVIEQDECVGGISKTVARDDFLWDLGPHRFFTKDDEITSLWQKILGDDFATRDRLTRIYYNKRFFQYPLRVGNALWNLGVFETLRCMASFAKAQVAPVRPEASFEDWVSNRFGKRLFQIFFKHYTEKVWGIPCEEISADWAAQRIRGLSLWKAVLDALLRGKGKKVRSLVESFEYPRLGAGMMYEAMAGQVRERGGEVLLRHAVTSVKCEGKKVVAVEARPAAGGEARSFPCDLALSSMPLPALVLALDPAREKDAQKAAEALSFRALVSVHVALRCDQTFPDNWIYVHAPEVKVGRITAFKNFSEAMCPEGTCCLGVEYFCNEGDEVWTSPDAAIVDLAMDELRQLGLVGQADLVHGFASRIAHAYPVYTGRYRQNVEIVRAALGGIENLLPIGRAGLFRYNNMDHAILSGLYGVRQLLGQDVDVWAVNADKEYLEEGGRGKGA